MIYLLTYIEHYDRPHTVRREYVNNMAEAEQIQKMWNRSHTHELRIEAIPHAEV